MDFKKIKVQILEALDHPEASEGLFLRNFGHLDQELDERTEVKAEDNVICAALCALIREGIIRMDEFNGEPIFMRAGA